MSAVVLFLRAKKSLIISISDKQAGNPYKCGLPAYFDHNSDC